MSELFPTDETLSPRLEWMRRYDVKINKAPDGVDYAWSAWCGDKLPPDAVFGEGATEDEAITALAKLMGWRLWNEEGLKL